MIKVKSKSKNLERKIRKNQNNPTELFQTILTFED